MDPHLMFTGQFKPAASSDLLSLSNSAALVLDAFCHTLSRMLFNFRSPHYITVRQVINYRLARGSQQPLHSAFTAIQNNNKQSNHQLPLVQFYLQKKHLCPLMLQFSWLKLIRWLHGNKNDAMIFVHINEK